jgi:uncharacterized protein with PIN domain
MKHHHLNFGAKMTQQASFRFYAGLNDLLPANRQHRLFLYSFLGRPAVKDSIEACGVPHTEIELILVNGQSVAFTHPLTDNDYVSVYPHFFNLDISPLSKLTTETLREKRFILDVHLGKLTRKLRMLGFDALYRNDYSDPEIARIALKEQRIVLTRDRGLLMITWVRHGYWVRSDQVDEQVNEILTRFDLFPQIRAFHRCIKCNGMIQRIAKETVIDRLLPKTVLYYDKIHRCNECHQLYWQGSHYQSMIQYIQMLHSQFERG